MGGLSWAAAVWMCLAGVTAQAVAAPTLESVESLTKQLAEAALQEHRPLDPTEVIQRLGEQEPELRSHYVLMYDSLSRQKASFAFPRVIAHTEDARFAMAFNGDPSAPGYYELEMYDYGHQGEAFRFRRIVFEPRAGYAHGEELAGEKSFPAYKPINEPLCVSCHGKQIRPNWESYDLWDGAYPHDDRFRSGSKYAFGYESDEHAGFDSFYTHNAGHGRYAFLEGLKEQFVLPIKDFRQRVAPSDFTQSVGYLNYRRVARLITETPGYATYKYAILGALYDCEDYESFFPEDVRGRMTRSLASFEEDTKKDFAADQNHQLLGYETSLMAKFRYVFEGRDVPLDHWSLSFRRSSYAFLTPGGSMNGFVSSLLADLDPALDSYRVQRIYSGNSYRLTTGFIAPWNGSEAKMVAPTCARLKQQSLVALSRR